MGTLTPEPAERPFPAAASSMSSAAIVRTSASPADLMQGPATRSVQSAMAEPGVETPPVPQSPPADPVPNASTYAPPLSPMAQPRPENLKARMLAAVEAAERSADSLARRAAESEVQVQLAADPDENLVRGMWQRISQSNQDILHDRELAVQTTVSGGTTFYRLRVGPFKGVSEARAVCQALKARGQDCIVARNG